MPKKYLLILFIAFGVITLYFTIPIFRFYYWLYQSDEIAKDFRISREISYFVATIIGGINMWICYRGLKLLSYKSFLTGLFLLTFEVSVLGMAKYYRTKDMLIEGKCQSFNPQTGKNEVCDCVILGAIKDEKTGKLIHPELKRLIMPLNRSIDRVKVTCETSFFDVDGTPILWFEQHENCGYYFYNQPGISPLTGESLKAVNPSNIADIRNCICSNSNQIETDTISNLRIK